MLALPAESVAVQITVVVPIGNTEPDWGLQVGVSNSSTLSTAVGKKDTTLPFGFPAFTTILWNYWLLVVYCIG